MTTTLGRLFARKHIPLVMGAVLLAHAPAHAATLTAASCDETEVQAQVTAAKDGDTVMVPAGSCTWSQGVGWKNKNVAVIGAGIGSTIITQAGKGFGISWDTATEASWRVSGFTFENTTAPTTDRTFDLDASNVNASSYGWRIDHVAMNFPVSGGQDAILVYGPTWGLIDHVSITKSGGTFVLIADFTADDYDSSYLGEGPTRVVESGRHGDHQGHAPRANGAPEFSG